MPASTLNSDRQDLLDLALSFLKALADETRLRLVGLLAGGEQRTVEELAVLLGVKTPTVSHHLALLKGIGLVRMTPEGTTHYYTLDQDALHRLGREVLSPDAMASLGPRTEPGAWEDKVLRDYLEGQRIKAFPAKWKKRLVILKWLAAKFEVGRRYPEAQVNTMLKVHHEDSATLRRELIETGLLCRKDGIYWKPEPPADEPC